MFKTILVPLDVHDAANAALALEHAAFFARTANSLLHLLYVQFQLPSIYGRMLPDNFDLEERKDALGKLDAWRAELGLPEDRVTTTLRRGAVAREVLREAHDRQADAIVVASHQPGSQGWLMGSNASAIVRDARVTTLVIRTPDRLTA